MCWARSRAPMRKRTTAITFVLLVTLLFSQISAARELRVCADPNNLPFSHRDGTGFENRIIELVARELGASVHYTWWPQRRGMLRNTLDAGECDVVPGIASEVEAIATTQPYYRSSYVFVARRDGAWATSASFDDPRLREAVIGVQLVGDDGANPPPAHALARRGMLANVRGFTVYGDYAAGAPQAGIIDALLQHEIDIAVVWGPTAGWFARQAPVPLNVMPVAQPAPGDGPMAFDISMGVRRDDRALLEELDRALARNATAIEQILFEAAVPVLTAPAVE